MKLQDLLRQSVPIVLLSLVSLFLPFLLISKPLFAFLAVILALIGQGTFLYLALKQRQNRQRELAALCFLSGYVRSLQNGFPGKASYEAATKYLLGYLQVIPFEDMLTKDSMPYPLGKYQVHASAILRAENGNETHLKNYMPLLSSLEESIQTLEKGMNRCLKQLIVGLISALLFFFSFGIILQSFPAVKDSMDTDLLSLISALCFGMVMTALHAESYLEFKGASHHVL